MLDKTLISHEVK